MSEGAKLAKVEVPYAKVTGALQDLGAALADIADEQVPEVLHFFKSLEALSKDARTRVRDRLLLWMNIHGDVYTAKGGLKASLGGYTIKVVKKGGGYDVGRLLALCNVKGILPEEACEVSTVYKPDNDKIMQLVGAKRLTEGELKAVRTTASEAVEVEPGQ